MRMNFERKRGKGLPKNLDTIEKDMMASDVSVGVVEDRYK